MGQYMQNDSLDVAVDAIVKDQIQKYKDNIKAEIEKHFDNPYWAATDIGKVMMYKKEIMDIIDKQ